MAQTISLLADALGLGSCMLKGHNNNKVNEFPDVDGVFETINNALIVDKNNENLNCEE